MTSKNLYASEPEMDADWRQRSLCFDVVQIRPEMVDAWIDSESPQTEEAKKVCHSCPVRTECLTNAIADPRSQGIRGGVLFELGFLSDAEHLQAQKILGFRFRRRRERVYRGPQN